MRLKRHIVFLLLLVFVFPVFYQAAHVLYAHDFVAESSCCTLSECHPDSHSVIESKPLPAFSSYVKTESCAICEYEFSVCAAQQDFIYESIITFSCFSYTCTAVQLQINLNLFSKSPRAPPAFVA